MSNNSVPSLRSPLHWTLIGICCAIALTAGYFFVQTHIHPSAFDLDWGVVRAGGDSALGEVSAYMPFALAADTLLLVVIFVMGFVMPTDDPYGREDIVSHLMGAGSHPLKWTILLGGLVFAYFFLWPLISRAISGQSSLNYQWHQGVMVHQGMFGAAAATGAVAGLWGVWWMLSHADPNA